MASKKEPLPDSDTNFKEIFDAFPESIIILDKDFSVLDMNDNAETTFTISRRKARGTACKKIMPQEIEIIAARSMEEERTVFGDEIESVMKNGEKISIQPVASPVFSKDGQVKGTLLQIKDLTGSKFLSSKNIQELSAAKFENLILGLAHELKNPLSGIKGAAQLLANEKSNTETVKCAEIITKEADRLKDLLDTLKQLEPFAKEVFELIDIHELLMEIIYLESMSDPDGPVRYRQNYDITLPPIRGDRNSLKQVFLNLIKNAGQSIRTEGEIEVSTRWITEHKIKGQNSLSIEIRDTGTGIPKAHLEKIFSPFYTTKKEGTGLGLFLAYQIVAKHGGAIFVESEVGKGSVFKVYLPLTTSEERQQ